MARHYDLEREIEELKAGIVTNESFRRLYVHFQPALERFFARCGVPSEERGDLTQETFLGIFHGIGGFRRGSRFEGWMFATATNVFRKHLRRRSASKRRAPELSLDEADPGGGLPLAERIADEGTASVGPEENLLGDERQRRLLRAIDELPSRMRECLVLRIRQELTYEEIATVMQLSSETVRSHLFQARRRLKDLLAEDTAAPDLSESTDE